MKTGTGSTTVNAANTFTGTVDVQAGTVQRGANGTPLADGSRFFVGGQQWEPHGGCQARQLHR